MKKLLIANRGEIACRIISSCRSRGIESFVIYSQVDEGARHTRLADESLSLGFIGGEGYLRGERILELALEKGCDSIHPGYGFLSENDTFARSVESSGLLWVGPPSEAIGLMGDKITSRSMAQSAGVRVVPGCDDVSEENLLREAQNVGYPVLLKATAGGGGRGMRVVYHEEDLFVLFREAVRESEGAFGNGKIFIEKFMEHPRHIEVQLLGDKHGNVFYWGVRECSLQRRHQKVIEESPSVIVDEDMMRSMGESAVMLAKEVGYYSAGTVEFIVDDKGEYYFLEMNTRLQVEHPVSEEVFGVDFVGMMLDVAQGKNLKEELNIRQENIITNGWSIEARICSEDATKGFVPSFGVLETCRFPEYSLPNSRLRVDTGVEEGDTVSMYYDAMIAKLIVWHRTREEAIVAMQRALDYTVITGLENNVGFLSRLLELEEVEKGSMTTATIEKHFGDGLDTSLSDEALIWKFLAATTKILKAKERRMGRELPRKYGVKWWSGDNSSYVEVQSEETQENVISANLVDIDSGLEHSLQVEGDWHFGDRLLVIKLYDEEIVFRVTQNVETWVIEHRGWKMTIWLVPARACPFIKYMKDVVEEEEEGYTVSPMPGVVKKIMVREGDEVEEGTVLLVVEAMKMENSIRAAFKGTVKELYVSDGEQVSKEQKLLMIG